MCEEKRCRAPPKWAPETGTSHGYQRGPQRRAWDAKAAAAGIKKPVCKHRSLSTPPLLGDCAAFHSQGPVIHGQLPRESKRHASGCCNVTPPSAATGLARIPYPSLPPALVSQSPLISSYFNPILSVKNRRPQVIYTQRWVQIQSWTPGAVQTKKRNGNLSQQPQEQRIKSPQSTWCTLHLWNTWIDNESSQNWGSGLWEQL